MSKIIRPGDSKAFLSARKFRKEPFVLGSRPAEKGEASPPFASKDESASGLEMRHKTPHDLVAEAESKAEQIVRDAGNEAEEIRRRAREEGRAEGAEEAKKKTEEHREHSSRVLSSFIEQMKEEESKVLKTFAPKLADLATELAHKIIQREIERDSSIVVTQAEEAISRILEREKLIIRVNPSDEVLMKEHKETLIRMFDGVDKIEVIGDSGIEEGGCIVETNLIKVDAQPASQLKRARRALLTEIET